MRLVLRQSPRRCCLLVLLIPVVALAGALLGFMVAAGLA